MATYDLTAQSITLTNLVTDGGMENSQWSGATYSTTDYHSGSRSLYYAVGTYVYTISVSTLPVVGHKYYAARWIKTSGDNQPADCRWEWYAGDGAGLNFVFGWNRGNHPNWERESSIYNVTVVNGTSYVIRCFAVNGTANMWIDDMILVDLTAAFGAGNEPDLAWCDANIPFFTSTLSVTRSMDLQTGDIINCPYSGAYKLLSLPKGIYKLECWGAQGGTYSSYYGGYGGYSYGTLTLSSDSTTLYLYSGGQPAATTSTSSIGVGGFNGGGRGRCHSYSGTTTYCQCGGGGTDIRIGTDSLYARVIVAGGGGGSASYDARLRNYGGGLVSGYVNYVSNQTSAGSGGSFGVGGDGDITSSNWKYAASGGGGGWYGGGADKTYADNLNNQTNSAGGSGYVYTASSYSNYPSGCLLNSSYYLTDAATVAGNTSFTDYSGTTGTGHSGHGAIRITAIKVNAGISAFVKVDGVWRSASSMHVKVGDVWKNVSAIKSNIGGTWR